MKCPYWQGAQAEAFAAYLFGSVRRAKWVSTDRWYEPMTNYVIRLKAEVV